MAAPKKTAAQTTLAQQEKVQQRMLERVQANLARMEQRSVNQMVRNNPFDALRELPSVFEYHPVEVPNPNSPMYPQQLGEIDNYRQCGFQHLTNEFVTRDGKGGTIALPVAEFDEEGRMMIAGCFIMYADAERYRASRARNVQNRNNIVQRKLDDVEETVPTPKGESKVRRESVDEGSAYLADVMVEDGEVSPSVFESE